MPTPNKGLITPSNGSDVGSWDAPMNGNSNAIDLALGGVTTINCAGLSGLQPLSPAQYSSPSLILSGALAASVNFQLPSGVGGFFFVDNQAGGGTVTFSSGSGASTCVVPTGKSATVVIDQTYGARLAETTVAPAPGASGTLLYNNSGAVDSAGGLIYITAAQALQVGGSLTTGGNFGISGYVVNPLQVRGAAYTPSNAVAFSSSAMTVNCALGNVFSTTLSANVTTAPAFSNPSDGQTVNWRLTQDGSGGRTMTWPTSFRWVGGTPGVLSTPPGSVDLMVATYFGDNGTWLSSLLKAFA